MSSFDPYSVDPYSVSYSVPQSLQGSCSGGNYYAAPMTAAFANLFPSAGYIDPATSQPPTPHPFGTPVNIPGSAGSIDFYPLVETGP